MYNGMYYIYRVILLGGGGGKEMTDSCNNSLGIRTQSRTFSHCDYTHDEDGYTVILFRHHVDLPVTYREADRAAAALLPACTIYTHVITANNPEIIPRGSMLRRERCGRKDGQGGMTKR